MDPIYTLLSWRLTVTLCLSVCTCTSTSVPSLPTLWFLSRCLLHVLPIKHLWSICNVHKRNSIPSVHEVNSVSSPSLFISFMYHFKTLHVVAITLIFNKLPSWSVWSFHVTIRTPVKIKYHDFWSIQPLLLEVWGQNSQTPKEQLFPIFENGKCGRGLWYSRNHSNSAVRWK